MIRFVFISILIITKSVSEAYNKERLLRLQFGENLLLKRALNYPEETFMTFTERSLKYGYPSQAFEVTTEDGYILTMFRMSQRSHCAKLATPPILLQHGLYVNAISWLDSGPKSGIPYLLADACFDVWCGNARGTEFSRNHTRMNPDRDPEFWQYSFHEIGLYDLPAMMEFILTKTNNTKLNYIAHSQGCTEVFVLGSIKPNYMEKLNVIIALAPAVKLKNTKSAVLTFLARNMPYSLIDLIGYHEVMHKHSVTQEFYNLLCHSKGNAKLCAYILSLVDGTHKGSISSETLSILYSHAPDGASLKNIVHISQLLKTGEFRQYDYSKNVNMKIYGKILPPLYDISKINVPVLIIYGENDFLVNSSDVRAFGKMVRNVREMYQVEDLRWNHLDFIWSSFVPKFVFPKIKECLDDYSRS